jgi:hypothetical protein
MRRCSHALAAGGTVWLLDPIAAAGMDGDRIEERVRALGEPAGVIQLLDRHNRDGESWAQRLGVPLHVVPAQVDATPFVFLPIVRRRFWSEVALWWPEQRVLVVADALGTISHYFRVGGERLGVHPLLRLTPPRSLRGLDPLHVLVGHGKGVHGDDTPDALATALAGARRRIPSLLRELPKLVRSKR